MAEDAHLVERLPPRRREVRGDPRPRYEIRWDDRTVSIFSPQNEGLQADPDHPLIKPKKAKKVQAAE